MPFDLIRKELDPVFAEVTRSGGVSIRFAHEDTQSHQNSHTFYLSYEGPLPPTARAKPADAREILKSKEARYKKLWEIRLAAQMAELPEYGEVFRLVRRALREAEIIGNK